MTHPKTIGRFDIVRVLGRGSQGVVYLARDPRLERHVAVKTIRVSSSSLKTQQDRLMREAKLVSRLQHPNIVPLYEAGEDDGLLFLVFEYVDGMSLAERIEKDGPIGVREAIDLMIQILAGIQNAHDQGIVHRDLSPSNILLDPNGLPRIMDFGISLMMGVEETLQKDVSGTPCYMSPEHFSKDPVTAQSDVFSLGLIFYEMVLGHPAVQADHYVAVMYRIASETLPPPSLENSDIERGLDEIFLRAVEKERDVRYPSAAAMRKDLERYLVEEEPQEESGKAASSHSTLEFLLRRIRHKGDFPTFSKNIMEVNSKASVSRANMASASELANAILKDYSLTNKLLRLVNSAFYGQFAGSITTVSRAVVILGFEQVRMAASCLMLFDHMKNSSHTFELKDAALQSFMSGMIAKDLADSMAFEGNEEAFICSMVHNLGRHLVLCYFPEEYQQIQSLMASKGKREAVAARDVLGISYEELGMGVARTWHFPDRIVQSMKSLPRGKPGKPTSDVERLQTLSSFSNDLIEATTSAEGEDARRKLKEILERFESCFPLSDKQLSKLLSRTRKRVEEFSDVLDVNLEASRLMQRLANRAGDAETSSGVAATVPQADGASVPAAVSFMDTSEIELPEGYAGHGGGLDLQSVLINGIQDITNTILGEYDLNGVLTMVLETMYRGFGLKSVLLCLREGKQPVMSARMGFGKDVETLSRAFRFPINGKTRDVFGLAVIQGKDITISHADDPRIRKRIPDWYYEVVNDPAFALFPMIVAKRPFGLFFLGHENTGGLFDEKNINYLRTLRNQAILAVKQKRSA